MKIFKIIFSLILVSLLGVGIYYLYTFFISLEETKNNPLFLKINDEFILNNDSNIKLLEDYEFKITSSSIEDLTKVDFNIKPNSNIKIYLSEEDYYVNWLNTYDKEEFNLNGKKNLNKYFDVIINKEYISFKCINTLDAIIKDIYQVNKYELTGFNESFDIFKLNINYENLSTNISFKLTDEKIIIDNKEVIFDL